MASGKKSLVVMLLFGAIVAETAKISTCVSIIDQVLKLVPNIAKTVE